MHLSLPSRVNSPLFLLLVSLLIVPAFSARPPLDANVTDLECELETDCPVRHYCFNQEDGSKKCGCNAFYYQDEGEGGSCDKPQTLHIVMVLVTLALCVVQLGLWYQTLLQLNKVKAFNKNSASGHVVILSMVANHFEIVMNLAYLINILNPSTYDIVADKVRPAGFGLCVIFKAAGMFEIPIMWMDIVIKSPGMNSPENKAKFKRIAFILRAFAIFVGLSTLLLMAAGLILPVTALILLTVVFLIVIFKVSSTKLALMICKNFSELGMNPPEDKFANSAEKSGHGAAKNILIVAKHYIALGTVFLLALVAFSITVQKSGTLGFFFICCFLASLSGLQHVFRGYVRLGARKKLAAAGYAGGSKVGTHTKMDNTSIDTKSSEESGGL